MKTKELQLAVVKMLNPRSRVMIACNVSWGWGLNHEADLLVIDDTSGGYRATEIELKVSVSDFRADLKKPQAHRSNKIHRLFYAMPVEIFEKVREEIPRGCGVITAKIVDVAGGKNVVATYQRQCRANKNPLLCQKDVLDLGRLQALKYWSLSAHHRK